MRNQSGVEDHKGRKVLVHTAQAIGQPCPQGRLAGNHIACVHQKNRRLMVDRVGLHGVDKREVIHHLSGPGKEIAHPAPRLTLLRESPVGRGNRKTSLAGSHARQRLVAANRVGQVLVVERGEPGLVIPHVHLRRGARHEEIDATLRRGWKVRHTQ